MRGPQTHRLFFALNPGERVRREVHAVQQASGVAGRAVAPANFHVTLAFLGMQEADVIPRACEVASSLTFEACDVVLDRLGRFKHAGVLWLGASRIPERLQRFQHDLVSALLDAGYRLRPQALGNAPDALSQNEKGATHNRPHRSQVAAGKLQPGRVGQCQSRRRIPRYRVLESQPVGQDAATSVRIERNPGIGAEAAPRAVS